MMHVRIRECHGSLVPDHSAVFLALLGRTSNNGTGSIPQWERRIALMKNALAICVRKDCLVQKR